MLVVVAVVVVVVAVFYDGADHEVTGRPHLIKNRFRSLLKNSSEAKIVKMETKIDRLDGI